MTDYVGIDYGQHTGVNRDKANGIHYGVISCHSLGEWINDVISDGADYGEPHCPKCGNEAKASDDDTLFDDYVFDTDETFDNTTVENGNDVPEWFDHKDYTCIPCRYCFWSDCAFSDEMLGWRYDQDGYELTDCLTNDVFVLKSPYYTYAQFCSPCVPGAGNLDHPIDTRECASDSEIGPRTYCLGHDWFEGHKAPYRVFKVEDDSEVLG